MTSIRATIKTQIHNFLTGRAVGTKVLDTAHETVEKAVIDTVSFLQGAVNGSKYPELNAAVRMFSISYTSATDKIYIKRVVCGTYAAGFYTYIIDIWRANEETGAGISVLTKTYIVANLLQGISSLVLEPCYGKISGGITINWDELVPGTVYTGANWLETGLYAFSTYPDSTTIGGGGDPKGLPSFTDNFVANGSEKVYYYDGPPDKRCDVDSIFNIVADFTIKNASSEILWISQKDELYIDGWRQIILHGGGWITIIADVDKFRAIGYMYEQAV